MTGFNLTGPVRGAYARRLAELVVVAPGLSSFASFVDIGRHLQVQSDWRYGLSAADRVSTLVGAAAALGVAAESMSTTRQPFKVDHWMYLAGFHGGHVVVSVQVCECHDGLEATLGHFQNRDRVLARALREVLPVIDRAVTR